MRRRRGGRGMAIHEINTAKRLLKIGFAPVDWLYSESLTKSAKSGENGIIRMIFVSWRVIRVSNANIKGIDVL